MRNSSYAVQRFTVRLILNFTFHKYASPPFYSGTAARRDGVSNRLKFKQKVK